MERIYLRIDIDFTDTTWPATWAGETARDCPDYSAGGYVNAVIGVGSVKYPVMFHNCTFATKASYNGYAATTAAFGRQYYIGENADGYTAIEVFLAMLMGEAMNTDFTGGTHYVFTPMTMRYDNLSQLLITDASAIGSTLVAYTTDGTRLIGEPVLVYDGLPDGNHTIEGPKFYKRNGWYYILAPAGSVKTGWQVAMRSRSPYGPYEQRVVMAQGDTDINGPHQGAWVETPYGEDWFLHFQDKGVIVGVIKKSRNCCISLTK